MKVKQAITKLESFKPDIEIEVIDMKEGCKGNCIKYCVGYQDSVKKEDSNESEGVEKKT